MDRSYWKAQLEKYRAGSLSAAEERALWEMLQDESHAAEWPTLISELSEGVEADGRYQPADWEPVVDQILAFGSQDQVEAPSTVPGRPTVPVRRMPLRRLTGVAAAILLVVAGVVWWRTHRNPNMHPASAPVVAHDALPGSNKAVLTLSGGEQIVLDSAQTGQLALQGASQVTKTGNGQLVYRADPTANGGTTDRVVGSTAGGAGSRTATPRSGGTATAMILYNTLSTPRGGQYQLTLPDGSKVWLNAASSITYPTSFTGAERKVEVTGEAYLEVAKDAARPFLVIAAGSTVQVLGTSFNINAYKDEPASRITLVDGRIAIGSMTLEPGEQASAEGGRLTKNLHADLAAVTAWRSGSFQFDHTDLASVMRQLSRWYDVDVIYEKGIPHRHFGGKFSRRLNLSEVLQVFGKLGLHYRIEGKQLIILPS